MSMGAEEANLPIVRVLTVCDEAHQEGDEQIFTLTNTRYHAVADVYPHSRDLAVYVLLHYRHGSKTFPMTVDLTPHKEPKRLMKVRRLDVEFGDEWDVEAFVVRMPRCEFPGQGRYNVRVWVVDDDGVNCCRKEYPFYLCKPEDEFGLFAAEDQR